MNIQEKITVPLEILVSTQNRSTLDFLQDMFVNNNINLFHILIINQTNNNQLLQSNNSNIRIINSFEKGISKSRNLAIENTIGEICLLADDDVVYEKNFDSVILNAFNELQNIDLITFKTKTTNNIPFYNNYPKVVSSDFNFIKRALSIEIAFKSNAIINKLITFDERFGLGSQFEDGENQLFFYSILKKKLKVIFYPAFIVKHKPYTSSDNVSSDKFIYARSALNYQTKGLYAYLYIPKLIFALLRRRLIGFKEIIPKYRIGLKAIKDIKKSNKKHVV